jgi:hypothetical protein
MDFQSRVLPTARLLELRSLWPQVQEDQADNGDGDTEAGEQADGLVRE